MQSQSITVSQVREAIVRAEWFRDDPAYRSAIAARVIDGVRVVACRLSDDGSVYDWTQCEEAVRDGDVFLFANGTRAGILIGCWPTIVVGNAGKLHTLAAPHRWSTYEGGKYAQAAAVARKLARPVSPLTMGQLCDETGDDFE